MIDYCNYCKWDEMHTMEASDHCDECISTGCSKPLPDGFEAKSGIKELIELMKASEGKKIDLKPSECKQLADFIEYNIFDVIRNDTDIDNIGWLECMMSTYKKLRDGEKNGNT
jgi:hypothetical protein